MAVTTTKRQGPIKLSELCAAGANANSQLSANGKGLAMGVYLVTFDSSYADAGEALSAITGDFASIWTVIPLGMALDTDRDGGYAVTWDHVNKKLIAVDMATAAEAAAAANLSTFSCHVLVIGVPV